MAKDGVKVDSDELLIYRLYELSCNEHVDIKDISARDLKKIAKGTNVVNRLGKVADITEKVIVVGLPDIQGKGNQYSLHQAMLRDEYCKGESGTINWLSRESDINFVVVRNEIYCVYKYNLI